MFSPIPSRFSVLSFSLGVANGLFFLIVAAVFFGAQPLQAASPQSVTATANGHLKAGRHAEAEKLLQDYLRSQPNGPIAAESRFLLAKSQIGQKRVEDALNTFSVVTLRFPGTEWAAQALEEQAQLHLQRRNPSSAQQLREQLLNRYPKSPTTAKVWTGMADGLFKQQKYPEALAIYQKLGPSLPPASAEMHAVARALTENKGDISKILAMAGSALDQNNLTLAHPLYEHLAKSAANTPALPQINTKLGWCFYLKGGEKDMVEAERLWRDVIKRTRPTDPWYAESKWHLVQFYAGPKNQWKEAVVLCEEIIREQQKGNFAHEQAMLARAWLLTVHGQGKEAVAAFDAMAVAYPDKIQHPPIKRHREQALAMMEKNNSK